MKLISALCAWLFLCAASYASPVYDAIYIRTLDADTHEFAITVWPQVTVQTKVRLIGIDTPETSWRASKACRVEENALGDQASIFAEDTLRKSQFVKIKDVKLGKFAGRALGDVILSGGTSLSQLLVEEGLAVEYHGGTKPDWCSILKARE